MKRVTPFNDPFKDPFGDAIHGPMARFNAGRLGMWLFLAVLVMTFASAIMGYVVVRINNGAAFVPVDAQPLPNLLLVSTLIIAVSSVTMQKALAAARLGEAIQAQWMSATVALALAFLLSQAFAWRELLLQQQFIGDNLYAWTFYVLTGLHAAHVIGGLVPLSLTLYRARRCGYGPADTRGITYCAMYWHFLGATWVVLYLTLWLGSST